MNLVNYLIKSMRLDTALDDDPAYIFTPEELEEILEIELLSIDPSITLLTISPEKIPLLICKSKIEVYTRLASATAPLYPLKARDGSLSENVRFDHYYALITKIQKQIDSGQYTFIEIREVLLEKNYFSVRNRQFAELPVVSFKVDKVYSDRVELSWNKFDPTKGRFHKYELYVSPESIVDEYADTISSNLKPIEIFNIHRTKFRVVNLLPNTEYYAALFIKELSGISGFKQIEFTTLEVI